MNEIAAEMTKDKDIPSLRGCLTNLETQFAYIDKHIKDIKEYLKNSIPKNGKFNITVFISRLRCPGLTLTKIEEQTALKLI